VHPLIQHTRVEPIKLEEALQAGEAQVSGPGNT
jgi:hypothetical protein